ncbi:MAG: NADPH-dependent FMN reductase [Gemmatimonadota bacterium]
MTASTAGPFRVLGIAGSLRRESFNRKLLAACIDLAPPELHLTPYDISPIPLYNGDVETEGIPGPVQAFRDAIAAADALLFCTPEYNSGTPGVLKNAIDWASRPPRGQPFHGKPAAIAGATTGLWGTARSQVQLRQTLTHLGALVLPTPNVFVAQAPSRFGPDGRLVDEPTREAVSAFLAAYVAFLSRMRGTT